VKRSIAHTQAWGARLYRFYHVPALVCAQCGHVWLASGVSQRIDRLIRKPPKPKKFLKVPVFSLADLPKAR
jgi:Zn-finger nucleic acid-binding protein